MRARITVTIGYSDASTEVMLTSPWLAEAAKSRFPNMSPRPISASNGSCAPGILRFGRTNATFSQGDFSYDSTVNLLDFNILAGRFGQALAPSRDSFRPTSDERDNSEFLA